MQAYSTLSGTACIHVCVCMFWVEYLLCFEILKKLSRRFLRFRIAKLGLGKEIGGTRSSWTAKLDYTHVSKIGGFL